MLGPKMPRDSDQPFFIEEPDNVTVIAGRKVLLRCVVGGNGNGRPVQWTFDNFGLGVDRGLSDYPQLRMVGANPKSKSNCFIFYILVLKFGLLSHFRLQWLPIENQ